MIHLLFVKILAFDFDYLKEVDHLKAPPVLSYGSYYSIGSKSVHHMMIEAWV